MKKLIFIFTLILINTWPIFAQPAIQWQKTFGGSGNDYASKIIPTNDGGFIIAGTSESNDSDVTSNNGNRDYWIVKIDGTGTIQWEKTYGGSEDDFAFCIQQTNDGGYIFGGYTESSDSDVTANYGHRDLWIVKTDSLGTIDWQKNYGGTDFEIAYEIRQTDDGGYIVAGYSNSLDGDLSGTFSSAQNFWLIKLDSAGTILWDHVYGGSASDEATTIQQTSDGGYILAGYAYSSNGHVTGHHGGQDAWVVKTDSMGVLQWQRALGGSAAESANSILQTSDGGYIVACSSQSNDFDVSGNHGGADCWIVKLDSTGAIQWQKTYGGSGSDGSYSINQTTDGGFIIAGYSTSSDGDVTFNNGDYDCWVIKINNSGTLVWQKSLGGTGSDAAYSINQTIDGGFILAASVSSNDGDVTGNRGLSDYWIVKLDSAQNVSVTDVNVLTSGFQISPNPFTNETAISFNNINSDEIKIQIHNLSGQIIKNMLIKNSISKAYYIWDGTNDEGKKVNTGSYFVTVRSNNIIATKKVLLLKD